MTDSLNAVVASTTDRAREGWPHATRGNASWFTFFSSEMTATKDMSAGVMEIAAHGGCLKPHRHEQAELYFLFEGSGLFTVEGVAMTVSAGQSIFIPGNAEHSVQNDTDAILKIFYVFPTSSFSDVIYRFPDAPQNP